MNTSKYLQAFQLFTNNDKLREWMNTPFYYENMAAATDALVLVITDCNNIPGLEKCKNEKLDLSKILPKENNQNLVLNVDTIKKAIEKIPLEDDYDVIGEDILCTECGSSGEVEWNYETKKRTLLYKYFDCPICKGSGYEEEAKEIPNGKHRPEDGFYLSIKNCVFPERIFSKIIKVADIFSCDEIILTHQTEYNQASKFKVSDIEIIVMPYIGMENFSKIIYTQK